MIGTQAGAELGQVTVITTDNRGATVGELAHRAADKIISIGSESDPVIREQALVFKDQIIAVLEYYLAMAVKAEHTTIANRLREAGCPELIKVVTGE